MRYGRTNQLHVANDMHAIYCAFAEIDGWVYVKVGMSARPVNRAKQIVCGSPFDIKRFVFCHIGRMSAARSFEKLVMHELRASRMRGEWYRFRPEFADSFKQTIRACFSKSAPRGKVLKWTEVPYHEFHIDPRFNMKHAG